MAKLSTKLNVKDPDIQFESVKIDLNASGHLNNGVADMAISVQLTPYRILTDGTVDYATGDAILRYAEGETVTKGDAAMQALSNDIDKAVEKFMRAKGK